MRGKGPRTCPANGTGDRLKKDLEAKRKTQNRKPTQRTSSVRKAKKVLTSVATFLLHSQSQSQPASPLFIYSNSLSGFRATASVRASFRRHFASSNRHYERGRDSLALVTPEAHQRLHSFIRSSPDAHYHNYYDTLLMLIMHFIRGRKNPSVRPLALDARCAREVAAISTSFRRSPNGTDFLFLFFVQ